MSDFSLKFPIMLLVLLMAKTTVQMQINLHITEDFPIEAAPHIIQLITYKKIHLLVKKVILTKMCLN